MSGDSLKEKVSGIDAKIDRLESLMMKGIENLGTRLEKVGSRLDATESRLIALEHSAHWEKVFASFDAIDAGLRRLDRKIKFSMTTFSLSRPTTGIC